MPNEPRLPYPLLTAALVLMWMLLNSFSPGQFLLGTALAVAASRAMAALQPPKPRLRSWQLIPKLAAADNEPSNAGRTSGSTP